MKDLPDEVDLLYVVGDPRSNNSNKLKDIALESHPIDVKMIESINEIEIADLISHQYIAVTSGASTPTYLTNQIIEFIQQFDTIIESTYVKPIIDHSKILN